MKNLKSSWGWRCWRDVIAALEATHPHVLHIQYQTGAYAMHPAINLLPWRLRGLPDRPRVAVTAHDLLLPYLFPKAGPLRRWVTRRLLADADAAVVTNEDDYTQLNDQRPTTNDQRRQNIAALSSRFVIHHSLVSPILIPIGSNIPVAPPPGYERAAWRARLGVAPDELLIVYFGLISHSKGLHVLLEALAQLPARFQLIVVGGEATQPQDRAFAAEIRRQIEERGLRERVLITGHCAADEVSAHLLAADLAALPFVDGASFRRGSLLATLAHGVPVITTTDPSPPLRAGDRRPTTELEPRTTQRVPDREPRPMAIHNLHHIGQLADGENVFLVSPEDPAGLAAAIERLASDVALRARLGTGGRALAAQFSWETIAEQHEALYRRLLTSTMSPENSEGMRSDGNESG